MIKAGIIGATGYAGGELVRLLLAHPQVDILWYGSHSYVDEQYAGIYRNFFKLVEANCLDDDLPELSQQVDVIFTATPQGYLASLLTEELLEQVKVIDLSADYRLKDVATYEKWYGITHKSPQLLPQAVYGLCEINREAIKGTRLVANPGCYTTCSILTAYPAVKEKLIDHRTLIIDAKSGTSGAGRGAKVANLYCEVNESIKAYGVASHRHTPEIEEQLGYACGEEVRISFTPHLVPMNRGILVTAYASLLPVTYPDGHVDYPTEDMIFAAYRSFYRDEYFIRILDPGVTPETRWVEGSNFVDIGLKVDERTHRLILMGALDNLVKGAAGQAVQNMNLLFDLPEQTGLQLVPLFP
jgi:N-acetyl-gamma-glutamyl-phosphate reductase